MKRSENRLFSTFLCGEQAVFYVKSTASTPCDTSEIKKEKENGENKIGRAHV